MTAKSCFTQKVGAGRVARRAGEQILAMLDELEADYRKRPGETDASRQAALDVAAIAKAEAKRKRDLLNRTIAAQGTTLKRVQSYREIVTGARESKATIFGIEHGGSQAPVLLRKEETSLTTPAVKAMLVRDPHEVHGIFSNVFDVMTQLRGEAHGRMAEAIRLLRPRFLGTRTSAARELELLRAAYGDTRVSPDARLAYAGLNDAINWLGAQYRAAGGKLAARKDWRLPNPELDPGKILKGGARQWRELVTANVDRSAVLDWATGKPVNDTQFDRIVEEAYRGFESGHFEGPPSAGVPRSRMLANKRDVARVFTWKSPEAWQNIAGAYGVHQSPWQAMMDHVAGLARDTALMRTLGPNPQSWLRFATDLIAREPYKEKLIEAAGARPVGGIAKLRGREEAVGVARMQAVQDSVEKNQAALADYFDEVTGASRVPVNTAVAARMGNVRSALVASSMGSAIISSLSDLATTTMVARFNRLPLGDVIRGMQMIGGREGEIFLAQQGLVADSLANAARQDDQIMGQTIRSSRIAKMGSAVIRASGLRLWTAKLRGAFALGWMTHLGRKPEVAWRKLEPGMQAAFGRYGIDETAYDLIRNTQPFEPRPNALLIRPRDVAAGGTVGHREAAEKFGRLINTEMEFAVIEHDPIARAWMLGRGARPGSTKGELLRGISMYRNFSASFVTLWFARALAKGFDGSRLGHAGLTILFMWAMGMVASQAKNMVAGRDPRDMTDWKTWGAALLQGGGLGVFGDFIGSSVTRDQNSFGPIIAGPIGSAADDVSNFIIPNVRKVLNGETTHFAGDALYLASKYMPGHNLWYARLALQRGILDQLALMVDDRARDRFSRMEKDAARNYGQDFYWRPGEMLPERAPQLSLGGGQ